MLHKVVSRAWARRWRSERELDTASSGRFDRLLGVVVETIVLKAGHRGQKCGQKCSCPVAEDTRRRGEREEQEGVARQCRGNGGEDTRGTGPGQGQDSGRTQEE